jgi:hypothetical protein
LPFLEIVGWLPAPKYLVELRLLVALAVHVELVRRWLLVCRRWLLVPAVEAGVEGPVTEGYVGVAAAGVTVELLAEVG